MALIGRGSRCVICHLPFGGEAVVGFPPFVMNPGDPVALFHDAAAHRRCFDAHPLALRTRDALEARERDRQTVRRCVVCGGTEARSEGWFSTGLVSSDLTGPDHDLNFVSLHRGHFGDWPEHERFRARLERLVASPEWRGPKLVFDGGPSWARDGGGSPIASFDGGKPAPSNKSRR